VLWPSGSREKFRAPQVNRVIVLKEGTGAAVSGR
jgi:hypothetical protein